MGKPPDVIFIKGQRYFLYRIYGNKNDALKDARQYNKRKIKSEIFKYETFMFREVKYALYFNKIVKIW